MLRRFGPKPTSVRCPRCGDGHLAVRRFCLRTSLVCDGCQRAFALADLAPTLGEAEFTVLAEAVGDRLSDRV